MLIAIEGGNAAGKATQTELLCKALAKAGPVSTTGFPQYKRPVGQVIKDLLTDQFSISGPDEAKALILQSLFVADRYEALPALQQAHRSPTNHMILDRYYASGLVYGQADGLSLEYLVSIHKGMPPADLWILLDVDPDDSSRWRPIPRDRHERDSDLAPRIRKLYKALFKSPPVAGKWVVVDGSKSIETVHADVHGHALSVISSVPALTPIDLARGALADHAQRQNGKQPEAGSKVWKKREPRLADYVIEHVDAINREAAALKRATETEQDGKRRVQDRLDLLRLESQLVELHAELRDTRFERDRAVFAYKATYDLAVKIARECADPERIDAAIEQALEDLKPDSEKDIQ
jgi:thymidylate kinase